MELTERFPFGSTGPMTILAVLVVLVLTNGGVPQVVGRVGDEVEPSEKLWDLIWPSGVSSPLIYTPIPVVRQTSVSTHPHHHFFQYTLDINKTIIYHSHSYPGLSYSTR